MNNQTTNDNSHQITLDAISYELTSKAVIESAAYHKRLSEDKEFALHELLRLEKEKKEFPDHSVLHIILVLFFLTLLMIIFVK